MRSQLVWAVGGALTLVSIKANVLELSQLARYVVENWRWFLHKIWMPVGFVLGIEITPEQSQVLSFFLFYSVLTLGTIILSGQRRRTFGVAADIRSRKVIVVSILCAMMYEYMIERLLLEMGYIRSVPFWFLLLHFSIFMYLLFFILLDGALLQRHLGAFCYLVVFSASSKLVLEANKSFQDYLIKSRYNMSFDLFAKEIVMLAAVVIIFVPLILAPSEKLIPRVAMLVCLMAILLGLSELTSVIETLSVPKQS